MFFSVTYLSQRSLAEGNNGHAATIVRGRTGAVSCDDAHLCNKQCAGVKQYEDWNAHC